LVFGLCYDLFLCLLFVCVFHFGVCTVFSFLSVC
jgi:hypothetical protein